MHNTKHLEVLLKKEFNFHLARIKFMAIFLCIVFVAKSTNLAKIAGLMPDNTEIESRYRRCQRFFSDFKIEENRIAKFLMKLYPGNKNKIFLAMDRTNWKFGKHDINILTLCITHEGIAFPVMWTLLDNNGGSSNTNQRIELIEKFISIFGSWRIESLLCDREFIGEEWIDYLKNKAKINFCIRIKEKEYINKKNGEKSYVKNFFKNLRRGETRCIENRRIIWGHKLYISGAKSEKGELIIVITDKNNNKAIPTYIKRWEIETFFKCLKSSGFNLEDTHFTDMEKISNLFTMLTIAFCWAYITGELECKIKPIKIKSHGRKAKSIFKVGLEKITDAINHSFVKVEEFLSIIKLLSCT
jgi:hypothetical protein